MKYRQKYPQFMELKGKIITKGYSQERLANEMCISVESLNRKLNGIRDWQFKEIVDLVRILEIHEEEINKYFFVETLRNSNKIS